MKITLESTDRIVHAGGAEARVWHGTTSDGVPCVAFITRIAVHARDGRTLERDLAERSAPATSTALHQAVEEILGPSPAIDARLLS